MLSIVVIFYALVLLRLLLSLSVSLSEFLKCFTVSFAKCTLVAKLYRLFMDIFVCLEDVSMLSMSLF